MSIYKKIHAIMVESEGLEKNMVVGAGTASSYKAISESAVLNVIKPLLKKHGIVIFPIEVEIKENHSEYQGKYGMTQRFLSCIHAKYKIVDIDTGEFEILETVGYGTDSQDKGSGQAMTYAYKSLIQKTFCLFSGEDSDNKHSDEIEKDNSVKQTTPQTPQSTPQPQQPSQPTNTPPEVKMPSDGQFKRMRAIASGSGKSDDEIKTHIADTFKKQSSKDLTLTELNKLIEWLEKK